MTKRFLGILILALFLLVACRGGEQTAMTEAAVPKREEQPTDINVMDVPSTEPVPTEAVSAEITPTETKVSEAGGGGAAAGMQMECTLVSDQPDAPAEYIAIFGITGDDWVKGPEEAAVTIVEYSDFQ